MGSILDSPSEGRSETLETMHALGLRESRGGLRVDRLARAVAGRWHGPHDEGEQAQTDDMLTVLDDLHGKGFTQPAVTEASDRVRLTAAGRVESRHPRPLPRHDPWNRR